MFIYFNSDEKKIPDGFISISEYSKLNSTSPSTILNRIRNKQYTKEDIIQFPKNEFTPHKKARMFIRKDAVAISKQEALCPEGYESVNVWAEKNGVSRASLSQMVLHNRIKTAKVGRYIYVKIGTEPPLDKRRRY